MSIFTLERKSRGKAGRNQTRGRVSATVWFVELALLSLDEPTEVRTFPKGRFELYRVGPMTIGRATYEPGWRWTEHVGGAPSCPVEHVGLVISGAAAVKMDDGTERVMRAGELFYVPPGHDSWVVGEEPYVSLHVMGSETYAAAEPGETRPGQ